MNDLKVSNYRKSNESATFPEWHSLNAASANEKKRLILKRLNFDEGTDGLTLVNQLESMDAKCERFDAKDDRFRLSQVVTHAQLPRPERVYVNWHRFDEIDELSFSDLDANFSDIWYPDLDDIDVFDQSLNWIISVAHSGQVRLIQF